MPTETEPKKPQGTEFATLIEPERQALKKFFGFDVEVPPLPDEITPDRVKEWEEKGFRLHYLPAFDLAELDPSDPAKKKRRWKDLPGWKGKLNREPDEIRSALPGGWVLFDTRSKPTYADGKQMYKQDEAIGKALAALSTSTPPTLEFYRLVHDPASRFGIRGTDFDKPKVRQALAEAIGIAPDQFDLAFGAENSVLMHMHKRDWGETNTGEWMKDMMADGKHRLCGGSSVYGGILNLHWHDAELRNPPIGFRPLGRFSIGT